MSIDFIILSMRHEDAPPGLGRHKTLKGIKDGLPSIGCCPYWLTLRVPANRLLAFTLGAVRWIGLSMSGHILPIQAILALQGHVEKPSHLCAGSRLLDASPPIIYVDGVRLAQHGVAVRTRIGGKLLIDFDDLISRRVARMLRDREDIAFGAFIGFVPGFVKLFLQILGPARTVLLRWEKTLLRRTELEAARTADAIAFASTYEAKLFQRFQRRHAPEANPKYLILGPSTRDLGEVACNNLQQQPPQDLRFIFEDPMPCHKIALLSRRSSTWRARMPSRSLLLFTAG